MRILPECTKETSVTQIKCEENKRKILFLNPNRKLVRKIKVDGCQITDGLKCDFLVKFNDTENFVELKGSDISHAFKQLSRTISLLGDNSCQKRYSFVISSRCPLTSTEIQNERLKFKKKYKSELFVKNNNHKIEIN